MKKQSQAMIKSFLARQSMATISTIDYKTGKPEAALIAFVELENLEIVFETFHDARKYKNLQHKASVALVVGWDTAEHITLQYEGEAHEISSEDQEEYVRIFLGKDTPCTEEFLHNSKVRLFKVRPAWIRYSDYTGKHPKIIEHDFRISANR